MIRSATVTALTLGLALAACAGPRWTKPGVSPDQAAADYSECNGLAQEANRRDTQIEQDILASRGHDWQKAGTMDVHQDVFAAEGQQRSGDIFEYCMRSKGYVPAP